MLNPSCNGVEGKRFPNLGDPPFSLERANQAKQELLDAGITEVTVTDRPDRLTVLAPGSEAYNLARRGVYIPSMDAPTLEVSVYDTVGTFGPFTFDRRWYYWSMVGPVPLAVAEKLYADAAACTAMDAMERLDVEMAKAELED